MTGMMEAGELDLLMGLAVDPSVSAQVGMAAR